MIDQKEKYLQTLLILKKVAHDIQSPLTALNALKQKKFFKDSLPETQLLFRALDRIQEISDELIVKKTDPSQILPTRGYKTPLLPLVHEVYSNILLVRKNLKIFLNYDSQETYQANIQASQFKSILTNILNNAIEACEVNQVNQSEIKISLKQLPNFIQIVVIDNGCGVQAYEARQIFKEGVSFNKPNGHGLGLYLAKEHLQSINSQISLKSTFKKGSQVNVQIPRCD